MIRTRTTWTAHVAPQCFGDTEKWQEWFALRSGAYSPCVDCSPAFRAEMQAACRCERPEVVFLVDTETREVEGLAADDPRYARLLLGMVPARGMVVTGRTVEMTPMWMRLLQHIRRRAHRDVQGAIDIWMRRYRKEVG